MSGAASLVEIWAQVMVAISWQFAALVVLGALCERLLRLRHPRVRHALWWFVLVAPLLLAPLRLCLAEGPAQMNVTVPVPRVAALDLAPQEPIGGLLGETGEVLADRGWGASAVRPGLPAVLATLWMVGCLLLLFRLAVGLRRARQVLAVGEPVTEAQLLEALAGLCKRAAISRQVGLRTSKAVDSAMLYGVIQPVIVLPQEWLAKLGPEHLRAMLAHEVAHVRRGDVILHLVQRVIEAVLFFHPGHWLTGRRIALAREELCDDWALQQGTTRSGYARTLAVAAEQFQARLVLGTVGLAETRFALLKRVEAIMKGHGRSRIGRPGLAILAGAALLVATAFAAVQLRAESANGVGGSGPAHPEAAPGGDRGNASRSILDRITLADLDPQEVVSYQVGRRVSDYPDREDLSSPERAYASINRAIARGDQGIWSRISAQGSYAAGGGGGGVPPVQVDSEEAARRLAADISEVWIYQGRWAGVIARMVDRREEVTWNVRVLALSEGRWLNRGESILPMIELARDLFARSALGPQLIARLTEEATAEAMKHPAQFTEMARRLFQDIRAANYRAFLTAEPEAWPGYPADYMAATDHASWVRWICTTFSNNPIVDVQLGVVSRNAEGRPSVPYRLTLTDGRLLAGDLPFYVNVGTGTASWQAGTGLDWHLQEGQPSR